jgi:glucosamine-6-phosphate deaminase
MENSFTPVEKYFFDLQTVKDQKTSTPYITVPDFPSLGLLTSLIFLEWVFENPKGVVSLPTGKTPEYFIKWTKTFLNNNN